MTDLAVATSGLVKRFGGHAAVDGIDLAVPTGSVFGFRLAFPVAEGEHAEG